MEKIENGVTTTVDYDLKIWKDEPKTQTKPIEWGADSLSCFVLLVDSPDLCQKNGSFETPLLGNKMYEYVVRACPVSPVCLRHKEENNIISLIRPFIGNTEYSLVLYSDTPLVTKSNILNILDFAKKKDLNVCKLTRGWVFKNEYIKRVDQIYAPSTYYFEEEDFMIASNFKQVYIVSQTLKNRIISYHQRNGVYFIDPDTTYVEANVSIGQGTVIEPYVSLNKNTTIEKNVTIGARSTLINAKVFEGAKLEGVYVDGGIIMQNAKIKNGAKIYSETAIGENAEIGEECIISNAIVGKHSMIGKFSSVCYAKIEDNVSVGSSCYLKGRREDAVIVKDGAVVPDFANIEAGIVEK